ncbi:MAG TPA: type II toxin-antitoxin system RelE/ParE family toxin [Rhodothermales bacterium]|nr:type II toxin-antitoxin system RelE/ParE family toxin [Rhodothermales bacterium]
MARLVVRFAESAVADLESMKRWYAEQGVPDVGVRLLREIFARVEALRDHPDMGRIVPEFGQPHIRELIHSPFRIVYRRDSKRLHVIRVWRSERILALPDEQ